MTGERSSAAEDLAEEQRSISGVIFVDEKTISRETSGYSPRLTELSLINREMGLGRSGLLLTASNVDPY